MSCTKINKRSSKEVCNLSLQKFPGTTLNPFSNEKREYNTKMGSHCYNVEEEDQITCITMRSREQAKSTDLFHIQSRSYRGKQTKMHRSRCTILRKIIYKAVQQQIHGNKSRKPSNQTRRNGEDEDEEEKAVYLSWRAAVEGDMQPRFLFSLLSSPLTLSLVFFCCNLIKKRMMPF